MKRRTVDVFVLVIPALLLKVGGYCLAGWYLADLYDVEGNRTGVALTFGIARAMVGVALGISVFYWLQPKFAEAYPPLIMVHLIAWLLCVALFFGRGGEDWSKVVAVGIGGTIWSCVLDLPAFFFALPLLIRQC
jgi:hypothetical protein